MKAKRATISALKQVPMVTPQTENSPPKSLVGNFMSPSLIQPKLMTEFSAPTAKSPPESLVRNSTAVANPYAPEAKRLKQEYAHGLNTSTSWDEEAMKVAAAAEDAMLLLNTSKASAKSAGLKTEGITPYDVQDAYIQEMITKTDYNDVMLGVAIEASKVDQTTDDNIGNVEGEEV